MIQITDTVQFENGLLSEQTDEFKQWYGENVASQITDLLPIEARDKYNRPYLWKVSVAGYTFEVYPQYIYETASNWAMSNILIKL